MSTPFFWSISTKWMQANEKIATSSEKYTIMELRSHARTEELAHKEL
jgi:hypothetical protein